MSINIEEIWDALDWNLKFSRSNWIPIEILAFREYYKDEEQKVIAAIVKYEHKYNERYKVYSVDLFYYDDDKKDFKLTIYDSHNTVTLGKAIKMFSSIEFI